MLHANRKSKSYMPTTLVPASPSQFGLGGMLTRSPYMGARANISPTDGARPMARASEVVSWDLFKWVVGALLAALTGMVVTLFLTMRSDIGDIRTKLDMIVRQAHEDHVELVKTISSIGGKLDQLSQDLRRR
jgi:hypothetical protein